MWLDILRVFVWPVPQVEALYRAARDELSRLDQENGELKGMLSGGADRLTQSR